MKHILCAGPVDESGLSVKHFVNDIALERREAAVVPRSGNSRSRKPVEVSGGVVLQYIGLSRLWITPAVNANAVEDDEQDVVLVDDRSWRLCRQSVDALGRVRERDLGGVLD